MKRHKYWTFLNHLSNYDMTKNVDRSMKMHLFFKSDIFLLLFFIAHIVLK